MYRLGGIGPDQAEFKRALSLLERRGPDDSGIWQDDHARLGHRRLAVVDLSPSGHQPMVSGDRRFVIVFNGEIYNHQELRAWLNPRSAWRGTSDTETLLEAYRTWGAECLQHLNGMFAFAIWDKVERTMFLARDRMGVKPLYYSARGGTFAFASRPGALALAPDADERKHAFDDGNCKTPGILRPRSIMRYLGTGKARGVVNLRNAFALRETGLT